MKSSGLYGAMHARVRGASERFSMVAVSEVGRIKVLAPWRIQRHALLLLLSFGLCRVNCLHAIVFCAAKSCFMLALARMANETAMKACGLDGAEVVPPCCVLPTLGIPTGVLAVFL